MKNHFFLLVFLCVFCACGIMRADNKYYVAGTIDNGNGSGDSWENATALPDGNSLYTLINNASEGTAFYIGVPRDAEVTFTPPTNPFPLKKGVEVYGGYYNVFNSDEPPRDFLKTILGFTSTGGRVISNSGATDITGALYDGFTVKNSTTGIAINISNAHTAVADQPVFRNLNITNCSGGIGGTIQIEGSGILTGTDKGAGSDPRYVETENKPIILENIVLSENKSSVTAGPVYLKNSNVKFVNLTATNNQSTAGAGGVIYATGSAIEINMGYFEGNHSSTSGGAVSTVHTPVTGGPYFTYLTFTNVTAKNNTANGDGGAFYIESAQNKRAIINFKDLLLSENTGSHGGGLCLTSVNDCILENIYVEKNSARAHGGGIYTTGYVEGGTYPLITYKNVTIRDNKTAGTGGGIVNTSMNFILEDFCIENNCSGGLGGGLYCTSTTGAITKGVNGRIKNNIARLAGGGGIYYTTSLGTELTNVEITGNYASGRGGGIHFTTAHHQVLKNCLIADNYSGIDGGGIFVTTANSVEGGSSTIRKYINTTITGNYAKRNGGGFCYGINTELTFENSIVSGNFISTGVSSDFRFAGEAYKSQSNYSLLGVFENYADGSKINLDTRSTELRNQDPKFERPADMQALREASINATNCTIDYGSTVSGSDFMLGSYRQTEDSPFIDKGNNDYLTDLQTDMDGRARVQNSVIDLGPYEGTGGEPYFECYEYCFPVMVWLGKNSDWQDVNNWYPVGVPADCTDVYIPGKSVTELAAEHYLFPSLEGVQLENICNRIFFMPGAQLGRPDLLTYNEAHVLLDYSGKSSTTTSDWTPITYKELVYKGGGHRDQVESTITYEDRINFGATTSKIYLYRGRWNMLSAPLKQIYTGDLAFGGFPFSFIKKYDPNGAAESYIVGRWAEYDSETDLEFQPGQGFGHFYYPYLKGGTPYGMDNNSDRQWTAAVIAANLTSNKPEHLVKPGTDFGLSKTAGILYFPYFFEDYLSDTHRAHSYTANSPESLVPGTSTFHYYYEDPLTSKNFLQDAGITKSVNRTSNSFRFIAEDENGSMNVSYNPGKEFSTNNNMLLIGNPYMGAIDFDLFHEQNEDEIKKVFHTYTGEHCYYNTYTGSGSPISRFIAPMQSFLVELTDDAIAKSKTESLVLVFDPNIAVANGLITLKSPESPESNLLKISTSNIHGETSAWLRRSEEAQDDFCIMDFSKIIDNPTERPEVYTLVNRENGKLRALLMNSIQSDDIIIPIGFLTTYNGENELRIDGMEHYQAHVFFVDAKENVEIEITGKDSFNYIFTSDSNVNKSAVENRFSLRFTPKFATGIGNNDPESKISAYVSKTDVVVNSSTQDMIQSISLYDIQGRCLARVNSVNAVSYTMRNILYTTGVYIVKVHTEQGVKDIKVVKS